MLCVLIQFVSGCLNGGAQVRPQEGPQKELTARLENLYEGLASHNPKLNPLVQEIYNWLGGMGSDKTVANLHTSYHAVEKMNTALNIKW